MYLPKPFVINDLAAMKEFVKAHPFGQLTSFHEQVYATSFIPFMISEDGQSLLGHLARQNEHIELLGNQKVCVTFLGPHGYISPTWSAKPSVPTWNYMVVRVTGRAKLHEAPNAVRDIVDNLSKQAEAQSQTDWDGDYPEAMLNHIVGVSVSIDEWHFKAKLSQNKTAADVRNIIAELKARQLTALADAMEGQLS